MKTRNVVIIVLILALAAGGFWYFQQPAHTPATAPAPTTASPAAPKPIAAPKAAPATTPAATSSATITAPTTTPDPQTELSTAIDDIISAFQNNEYSRFYQKYTEPAVLAKRTPQEVAADEAASPYFSTPSGRQFMEQTAKEWSSLKMQTPVLNPAGNEATYQVNPVAPGIPPGTYQPKPVPVTFIKIDGKWYIKTDGSGGVSFQ